MHTVEWEPGLRDFLPDFSSLERQVWRILKIKKHISVRCFDPNPLARRWVKNSLVREILSLTSSCWSSSKSGWTMSGCRRTRQQFPGENYFFQERIWTARPFQDKSRIWRIGGAAFFVPYHVNRFQHLDSNNLFDYLNNSGRYFLSFWGPMKTDSKHQKDYIIDIFDRSTQTKGQYSILCSNYYWTFLQFVAFPSCTASRILCGLCQSWASSCSLILIFLWSR